MGKALVSMVAIGLKSFMTNPIPVKTMAFFAQLSPQSTSLSHASVSCPILLVRISKNPSYGTQPACKRSARMCLLTHGANSTHTWSADTELYQSHEPAAFTNATQLDMRRGNAL